MARSGDRGTLAAILAIAAMMIAGDRPEAPRAEQEPAVREAVAATDGLAREAIAPELRSILDRLDVLRGDPTVKPDYWADAHLFAKELVWTLDFEATLDTKKRGLVLKALRRARERLQDLAAGRHPWAEKRGRVVRGFRSAVDGSTQPYGMVIPDDYDPASIYRLDVVLHGSTNASGIGGLSFVGAFDDGDVGGRSVPGVDFIEVHPMGRLGENAYRFEGETDVDEAIEAACRNYSIDRKRIVLRGSSLGGVGTWQLGLKRPDRYAALGPCAGPVDTEVFANSPWPHFVRLAPLTPWQKTTLHMVDAIDYTANAGMVPVVAAMGDKDPYFGSHLLIQKAFEQEGILFVGLVDHGGGHSVSGEVFREQLRLLGERAAKGVDPSPAHIRFVTWTLKFSRCHWIEILGLRRHYERAEVEARKADDGSIAVAEPTNITCFSVDLPASFRSAPDAALTIGGAKIALPRRKGEGPRTVVFGRRDGRWAYLGDRTAVALGGKRPGLQGPIDDAFAAPFLCVRGTGTPWNPAVSAWAEASLRRFAHEWRRHYRGDLRIKDDVDLTQDDVRRFHLILFGDPGSNRWIADALPRLPLRWTREELRLADANLRSADHAPQLICPNPLPGAEGHYVVLNGGHTYHEPELRFSYMVFPRLGDWAVVKVGDSPPAAPTTPVSETILHSGFFDEQWR